jgi:hypothetical protein
MAMTKATPSLFKQPNKGSIILEAFIAITVISVAFAVFLDIGTLSVKTSTTMQKSSQANFLLKETMEAVRSYRDATTWTQAVSPIGLGAANLGSANPYYLALNTQANPNTWVLTSGTETTGIYQRSIVFDSVYRDAGSNIVTSGGTLDANTKKVTVTVTWPEKTMTLVTYLTNWKQ